MKKKCKQCGKCCKGIRLNFELPEDIKSFFEEITQEEAFKIQPLYRLFSDLSVDSKYYNCKKLINNKCSVHDNKPDFCKNYPSEDGFSIVHEYCGYFNEDDLLDIQMAIGSKILSGQEVSENLIEKYYILRNENV
jgi:Fe-S-cluster containining protein